MTTPDDDLSDLRAALDAATPRPDPAVRAAHLRLARDGFERLREAPEARPGRWAGIRRALGAFAGPGALGAATAAAFGVLVLTPLGGDILQGPLATEERAVAPVPAEPGILADRAPKAATPASPDASRLAAESLPESEPATVAPAPPGASARMAPSPDRPEAAGTPALAPRPQGEARAPAGSGAEEPISEVAIGPGTGSADLVRASLLAGALPPPEGVRVGELVGAFSAARGRGEAGLRPAVSVLPAPWDPASRLVVVALEGLPPADAAALSLELRWNPATVAAWDLLAAGTLGPAGEAPAIAAIYEVAPTSAAPAAAGGEGLGTLRLRWTGDGSRLLRAAITGHEPAGPDARFAAALAGWGLLLRGDARLGGWDHDDAIALARESLGEDPSGPPGEALALMRLSQGLDR